MPRVKRGVTSHRRHKKILKMAKGYRGAKSKLYRVANQQVMKSGQYAYIHRKLKKRDFRKLWIARINAAARDNGTTYSRMVHGLKVAGVDINRKMLAELAISDPQGFTQLAELSKHAVNN
ncbi:MAG: 50S ribosomal protein L20 [Syntrophomonadaceae bacterium]|jgi:large subunit ribosomal protein L20|nr:50S ribosomal protein L20 [Syntrophomonadaceae bacterium]